MTVITGPAGQQLTIDRTMVTVSYLSDADRAWTFTDTAGHPHHCAYDDRDRYPTLTLVTDEVYWCHDCHDEHELTHWACRQCGEHITPGTTGPGVRYIPGLITCTLDGQPITTDRAIEIATSWTTATRPASPPPSR